jgi:Phytoene/squalene synthetase
VNPREPSIDLVELPPLQRLLLAYAPPDARAWHSLIWQLDARLAELVRRRGDPTIAAIRLAWWDAVLVEGDQSKGSGEPLVEQWRRLATGGAEDAADQLIDGWRVLISPDPLNDQDLLDYAQARGGGLFRLLAGAKGEVAPESISRFGAIWALWDLAGHVHDDALALRSIKAAQALHGGNPQPPKMLPRPLRLLVAVTLPDVRAARIPSPAFTPRHYARLLMAALRG